MQYLLLIYEAEEIWESKTEDEQRAVLARHQQLHQRMEADGVTWTGEPLMPTATAVSVRSRNGARQVTDGPFAETKEQLGGFYLVDVESVEQAIAYAELLPNSETGTVEVRPLANHTGLMD